VLVEINPAGGQPGKRYVAPGEIVVPPSFFLAKPSPDELAEEAEADADGEDDDPLTELDPEIFGPEELDGAEEALDIAAREELSSDDDTPDASTTTDELPSEPAWFERSRIAMALRSGEVLLLGPKVAQPASAGPEDAEKLEGGGGDDAKRAVPRGRPPTSDGSVPF